MNGRPWTAQHTKVMRVMLSIGCTHALVALQTGHCVDTVQRRAAWLGLTDSRGVKYGAWEDLPVNAREAIRRMVE